MLTFSGISYYSFMLFCSEWGVYYRACYWYWYHSMVHLSVPDSVWCLINLLWDPKLASSLESWSFFWKRLRATRCSEISGNTSAWQCTGKLFILWC